MSLRLHALLFVPGLLLIAAVPARQAGADSSFRLAEIEPAARGAVLKVAFANEWGSPATNKENADVELFGHTVAPAPPGGNASHSEDRSMPLGTVCMLGSGMAKVPLNYEKLKLTPGQAFCVSGAWVKSGHRWGESWTGLGRGAGTVTLPAPLAQKNSALAPRRLVRVAPRCSSPSWRARFRIPLGTRPRLGSPNGVTPRR